MHQVSTQLGALPCQVLQGDAAASPKLLVVLCHGFGAPGEDLVPLGAELLMRRPPLARAARFIFPAAPLSLEALGMPDGRAWWHLDIPRLMELRHQGAAAEQAFSEETPEGLVPARRRLLALVEEATRQAGLGVDRLVLGGFSQGSMLATDVCLALDEAPAGLVVLSGTLVNTREWQRKASRRRGLPVLQTHGRHDPTLSFASAEALRDLLQSAGLQVDFRAFDGGHTIPRSALEALGDLLEARLPV